MDYKYINQLLEHYWRCETTLEEEEILRAFFAQEKVPGDLLRYRPLFAYQQQEKAADVLGDDFDEKILSMTEEPKKVKARVIKMSDRLRPLFKAAAVVAIFLTLGNAMQMPFNENESVPIGIPGIQHGSSVAIGDSSTVDTLQQSSILPKEVADPAFIK